MGTTDGTSSKTTSGADDCASQRAMTELCIGPADSQKTTHPVAPRAAALNGSHRVVGQGRVLSGARALPPHQVLVTRCALRRRRRRDSCIQQSILPAPASRSSEAQAQTTSGCPPPSRTPDGSRLRYSSREDMSTPWRTSDGGEGIGYTRRNVHEMR
jgi:hypothetical protein